MATAAPAAVKRTKTAPLAPSKPSVRKADPKTAAVPTGIKARRGSKEMTAAGLRAVINPNGNTVLKNFGRALRDEPHKYIYPIKLYLKRSTVRADAVTQWMMERYINAKGGRNHGARYEIRTYKSEKGKFVDYILLEKMTDDERVMFTLEFGDVTDEKVVRDGKLRRPRLNKAQKDELDEMINAYYLRIAAERRAEQERRGI
ncbi:MAG: hypothetical protein DI537_41475 [Stutzerimonas stutzeri]|nr:MAG: hypothetical protein DI537_41475 [Stutzerimonas stutzeri]